MTYGPDDLIMRWQSVGNVHQMHRVNLFVRGG